MNIINQFRKRMADRRLARIIDNANDLFQICEHNGELWVTYAGNLVLPCAMLNSDRPEEAIAVIRHEYIKDCKSRLDYDKRD